MSGSGFFADQFVRFKMIGTAFGMADDDIRATQVFEHQRADVAGMGAFFGKMDILRAEGNLGAAQGFFDRSQQRERRTDQKFAVGLAECLDFLSNALSQSNAVFQKAVHFPVACNEFFSCHNQNPFTCKFFIVVFVAQQKYIFQSKKLFNTNIYKIA